jgi:hypothetical protein
MYKVSFELPKEELPQGVAVKSLAVLGDFNGWNAKASPLKLNKKGVYTAMVELAPGETHQFRYLLNGEVWFNDADADGYAPSGHGTENGLIDLPVVENGKKSK